jgi:hypothetical protein
VNQVNFTTTLGDHAKNVPRDQRLACLMTVDTQSIQPLALKISNSTRFSIFALPQCQELAVMGIIRTLTPLSVSYA